MYLNCTCEDGSVPTWFLNEKTGAMRFVLLSCKKCDGTSDMGNGQRVDEVKITEAKYNELKSKSLHQAV